VAQKAE
jgi:hypothetical protein